MHTSLFFNPISKVDHLCSKLEISNFSVLNVFTIFVYIKNQKWRLSSLSLLPIFRSERKLELLENDIFHFLFNSARIFLVAFWHTIVPTDQQKLFFTHAVQICILNLNF